MAAFAYRLCNTGTGYLVEIVKGKASSLFVKSSSSPPQVKAWFLINSSWVSWILLKLPAVCLCIHEASKQSPYSTFAELRWPQENFCDLVQNPAVFELLEGTEGVQCCTSVYSHTSNALYSMLFFPVGEQGDWHIGDTSISMQVHVSAESDNDELSQQSKHLGGMCCHEIWGGIITCHCPALFCFSLWSRLDSIPLWLVVNLFVASISYCMMWKKVNPDIILCWVFLSCGNCMVAGCLWCYYHAVLVTW